MENDLRDIWGHAKTEDLEFMDEKGDSGQVKSKDLIHRIEHKLTTENAINIVFTIGLGLYLAITQKVFYLIFLLVIMIPIVFYYRDLINKINRQRYDEPVKAYLTDIHGHLKRFVIHYKIIGALLALVGLYIGMKIAGGVGPLEELKQPEGLLKLLTKVTLASALAFGIIHLLYGRSVRKLRKMIEDMD